MVIEYAILLLLFIAPGYLVLRGRFADDERLALAAAASAALYGAGALACRMLGLPLAAASVILPASVVVFLRGQTFSFSKDLKMVFATAVIACFAAQSLAAPQAYDTDGIFQMVAAKSFLTDDWMAVNFVDNYFEPVRFPQPITYRPPLNNVNMGLAFSLLGYSYEVAVLYSMTFTACLAAALYLAAGHLFGQKTAFLSSLALVCLNPYVLSSGFRVHAYNITAYLILCFLYLWQVKAHHVYLGVLAGMLYLTHSMGLVFLVSYASYQLFTERGRVLKYADGRAVAFVLVAALVVSPWLYRNFALYGDPFYQSSRHVMVLTDLEQYFRLDPPKMSDYLAYLLFPANMVMIKGGAVWKTFMPVPYSAAYNRYQPLELFNPLAWGNNMMGLLSPPLMLASVYFALRNWRKLAPFLFWSSMLLSLVLLGYRVSFAHSLMYAPILLLGAYGIHRIGGRRRLMALVAAFLVIESWAVYSDQANHSVDNEAASWILANTKEDAIIMSRQHVMINYMTGRKTMPTPKEGWETIYSTMREYGVTHYAVHFEDLRLRDVNLTVLNGTLKYRTKSPEYWIYEVG
ncbi:MAG: glycosyltransferase family 39 protein [Candidatus Altiarchaeota archaeon]